MGRTFAQAESHYLRLPITALAVILVAGAAVAAADEFEIPILPGIAPGSAGSALKEEYRDRPITDGTGVTRDRSVRSVTRPTLTVYLPTQHKATGAAVVVCPGGGFGHLAIDKEGHDVARWLQSRGIAGAVVKYRLPDSDVGLYVPNVSIPDMQRAIRIVRLNAGKWEHRS